MSIGACWADIWGPVWAPVWRPAGAPPLGEPTALQGHTAEAFPRRPLKPWPFGAKDPDEIIWVCFDFRRIAASVTVVSLQATRYSGAADASPQLIMQGEASAFGPKVYQRVVAGVDACTYHFECLVDAPDGSRFSLAALLPVRSA